MPHICVKLWPGRSEEQKLAMAQALVDSAARTLNADPEWFTVSVEEISPDDWESQVVQPEILGKEDTLYYRNGK